MGAQYSSNLENALSQNFSRANKVQVRYQKQIFSKNMKSSSKFREELISICKRSAYLSYEWAKQLIQMLKRENKQKLYSQYKQLLKENCLRQGKNEKNFCPAKIRQYFLINLQERKKQFLTNISHEQLTSIIQQCKAYLMVMTWLHQLVSLKNSEEQENQNIVSKQQNLYEEKQVYQISIMISEIYFRNKIGKEQEETVYQKKQRKQLMEIVKEVNKCNSFLKRQELIFYLNRLLLEDIQNFQQNVQLIYKILGKSIVLSNLYVIHQIGNIDVSLLWQKLVSNQKSIFEDNQTKIT